MQRNGKFISYVDSYGCRMNFLARGKHAMDLSLKKRKFAHVLPEVVELLERVQHKGTESHPAIIKPMNISLELCVDPGVIDNICKYLSRVGLLGKAGDDAFKIERPVEDTDYGAKAKEKAEEQKDQKAQSTEVCAGI